MWLQPMHGWVGENQTAGRVARHLAVAAAAVASTWCFSFPILIRCVHYCNRGLVRQRKRRWQSRTESKDYVAGGRFVGEQSLPRLVFLLVVQLSSLALLPSAFHRSPVLSVLHSNLVPCIPPLLLAVCSIQPGSDSCRHRLFSADRPIKQSANGSIRRQPLWPRLTAAFCC